jgi:hypothetical protein
MPGNGWITEGLVQFSESPLWKTPVENFIDDNCCIFSTDSEMKLEYTVVHHKFRDLIDSLLTSCVEELGVPVDTAVKALRASLHERSKEYNARTQRHAAKKMLTQVFSADNFSSFYTMMVKRNLELDILASASLTARGVNLDSDDPMHTSAELHEEPGTTPARAQRALDANGDLTEDEALRRAIEASLQDPQAQEQVRAYSEVCAQEKVNLQVEDVEREAQHQKMELEAALSDRAQTPEVEQYRKERLEMIEKKKNSQIMQIQNYTLSGPKQSFYHEKRRPTAEFSSPELPEMPLPVPSPEPIEPQHPQPMAGAINTAAALPPIGHQQTALPSIARKGAAAAAAPSSAATAPGKAPATATATTTAAAGAAPHATAAAGPSKKELEERAQYMRQQREMIVARNRATREQQLNSYVQQSQPSTNKPGNAAGGGTKDLTVEIARRLRGDIVGEGRKGTK